MSKKLFVFLLTGLLSLQFLSASVFADENPGIVMEEETSSEHPEDLFESGGIADEGEPETPDGALLAGDEETESGAAETDSVETEVPDEEGENGEGEPSDASEAEVQAEQESQDLSEDPDEEAPDESENLFQAPATFSKSGYTYEIIAEGTPGRVALIGVNDSAGPDFNIPSSVSEGSSSYDVVTIRSNAFANVTKAATVTIPASVCKLEQNSIRINTKVIVTFVTDVVEEMDAGSISLSDSGSYVVVPRPILKNVMVNDSVVTGGAAKIIVKEDAGIVDGYYFLVSGVGDGTSHALDVSNGAAVTNNGANVDIYAYDQRDSEIFYIRKVDSTKNYYTIASYSSGRLIDIDGAKSDNKTNALIWGTARSTSRTFTISYASDGTSLVISPCYAPQMALDVYGGKANNSQNVDIYKMNGSAAQNWSVVSTSPKTYTKGADADIADGYYYLVSGVGDGTSFALDTMDGYPVYANGANVDIYQYDKRISEIFYVRKVDTANNYYTIMTYSTGKLIDIDGAKSENGANAQLWGTVSAKSRTFTIKGTDLGTGLVIAPSYAPGMAFDVSGGKAENSRNVRLYKSNNSDAQCWRLVPANPAVVPATITQGIYTFHTALGASSSSDYSTRVLDVYGGSLNNSANVQLYDSNDTNAQKFFVIPKGDGFYSIINGNSRKSLDIYGGKNANKANVQQYTGNGSNAQIFRIMVDSNGFYSIFPASSLDKCIDIDGAVNANKRNVQIYQSNGSNAQKWSLEPTTLTLTNGQLYTIVSVQDPNKAIDVQSSSVDNGALLNFWTAGNNNWQKWKVKSLGGGFYELQNVFSGKVIDMPGGKLEVGRNPTQYTSNSSNAQKFKIYSTGDIDGSFFIETTNGLRVATETTAANGVKLVLADADDSDPGQKFLFNATANGNDLCKKGSRYVSYSYGVQAKKEWKNGNYFDDDGYLADGWTYVRVSKDVKDKNNKVLCTITKGYWYYFKEKGDPVSDAREYMMKFPGVTTKTKKVIINKFDSAGNRVVELGPDGVHPTDSYYKTVKYPDVSYKFVVDRVKCVVNIFAAAPGTSNYNIPVYAVYCSPGAPGTETDLGNYTTSTRTTYGYLMGPSWGQYTTHFNMSSGEFFHAVAGEEQNYHSPFVGSINALGTPQTHGCVRLSVRDAYWIYAFTAPGCPVTVTENYQCKVKVNPKAPWDKIAKVNGDPTDPWLTGNYSYYGN